MHNSLPCSFWTSYVYAALSPLLLSLSHFVCDLPQAGGSGGSPHYYIKGSAAKCSIWNRGWKFYCFDVDFSCFFFSSRNAAGRRKWIMQVSSLSCFYTASFFSRTPFHPKTIFIETFSHARQSNCPLSPSFLLLFNCTLEAGAQMAKPTLEKKLRSALQNRFA